MNQELHVFSRLQRMMRVWYESMLEARVGTLVFEDSAIMLGRSILAERCDDGTIIVNAFHWPGNDEHELIALFEAVPWHRIAVVSESHCIESLEHLLDSDGCVRTFDRVVVHGCLGVGPVVGANKARTTCMFSGQLRSFVTDDIEKGVLLTELHQMRDEQEDQSTTQ